MEDLGKISVSPKLARSEMVCFLYKGRPSVGMVALIDPYNWEKRPGIIPRVHVHMSEDEQPPKKSPAGTRMGTWPMKRRYG